MYQAPEVIASFDATELLGDAYGTPSTGSFCHFNLG